MPLASIAAITTIRAALVEDVTSAWGVERVYTSAPEVETARESGNLPVAWVLLDSDIAYDSEASGLNNPGPRMRWTIQGRFAKDENIDLAATKDTQADALLELLTATANYHGAIWFQEDLTYRVSPDESDAARGFYEIAIGIVLHG
jgi:hypothetical protein